MAPVLLPHGLQDILPGEGWRLEALRRAILDTFQEAGYQLVIPPLMTYARREGEVGDEEQGFTVADPESPHTLMLRADFTPSIMRMVADRLHHQTRPLRLCYAGDVVRPRGTMLRPERQFLQFGAECIGLNKVEGVAETVTLALDVLAGLGCERVVVDVTLPGLARQILKAHESKGHESADSQAYAVMEKMIRQRDVSGLRGLDTPAARLLAACHGQAGPLKSPEPLVALLSSMPEAVQPHIEAFHSCLKRLGDVPLYFDPLNLDGQDYHHTFAFTLLGGEGVLGRGGVYAQPSAHADLEDGVGFSLFSHSLSAFLPQAPGGTADSVP